MTSRNSPTLIVAQFSQIFRTASCPCVLIGCLPGSRPDPFRWVGSRQGDRQPRWVLAPGSRQSRRAWNAGNRCRMALAVASVWRARVVAALRRGGLLMFGPGRFDGTNLENAVTRFKIAAYGGTALDGQTAANKLTDLGLNDVHARLQSRPDGSGCLECLKAGGIADCCGVLPAAILRYVAPHTLARHGRGRGACESAPGRRRPATRTSPASWVWRLDISDGPPNGTLTI